MDKIKKMLDELISHPIASRSQQLKAMLRNIGLRVVNGDLASAWWMAESFSLGSNLSQRSSLDGETADFCQKLHVLNVEIYYIVHQA